MTSPNTGRGLLSRSANRTRQSLERHPFSSAVPNAFGDEKLFYIANFEDPYHHWQSFGRLLRLSSHTLP